ncbi:hypothetical protein WY02_03520 [Pseudonocardia sp. AL041005-10]|nr:hypothetical protein [Pseudonocardia sp. AL041005-10]ALE77671.1 hypothetical protein WY02_03520 [Pseudonocardia sp. AL041005-10]
MTDTGGGGESLFEEMMAEAVDPLYLELPDGDDTAAWTLHAVDSDGVIDLDDLTGALDVVEALVGDELAGEVLDVLADLPWDRTLDTAALLRRHFTLVELRPGLWPQLVEQIDLYGEAIESDLADRGIDLLDFFRGARPWTQLARMLPRLPEGSRYRAALLDDEDLARARIEAEDDEDDDAPSKSDRPPLIGETQDRALLRQAVSFLRRIEHGLYNSRAPKSKRSKAPDPLKGPETAEDRLRDLLGDADVEDIFDQVTPGWNRGDDVPSGFKRNLSGLLVPDD